MEEDATTFREASSFREMVKKKREEVKSISQSTIRRRESDSFTKSRSSTLDGSHSAGLKALSAGKTATTAKPPKKIVSRKSSSGGLNMLQSNAASLPELLGSDGPKLGSKKSLPSLRSHRSQSMSLSSTSDSSSSNVFRPSPTIRPSSSMSKTSVSMSQPSFLDSRSSKVGRITAARSRPVSARRASTKTTGEDDFPKVMAVQIQGQPRPKSASFRQLSASTPTLSERAKETMEGNDEEHSTREEDISCLKKENQPNVPKRVYKPTTENPAPWNGSVKSLNSLGGDGRRTPTMSRAGSANALDRRPDTAKSESRQLFDQGKKGRSSEFVHRESVSKESDASEESLNDTDRRGSQKYPVTPHQLHVYQTLYLDEEELEGSSQNHPYNGPPFYVTQSYKVHTNLVIKDLSLAITKICSSYKVLCTRFWRNEKIVDADVEGLFDNSEWDQMDASRYLSVVATDEYPDLMASKPSTLAAFIRHHVDGLDRLEQPFHILLIREADLPGRKPTNVIVFVAATTVCDENSLAFVAKEILSLYFECARYRVANDSDFQIYSVIGSHTAKEEADDFVDFAYAVSNSRPAHLFWRDICIETVQDMIEGNERDEIENKLRKMTVDVENLRTQVQSVSKRKNELDVELSALKEQRRQMEVEAYEGAETYKDLATGEVIEISKTAKSALIRTVLGEEAVTDNISALLAKHDCNEEIQRHIGHMTLEAFSQISEDQLTLYGMLTKDRRKILALSEYVRNRIKESLQEQTKVKYSLERKIMKLQRELDICNTNVKTSQNSLDANDDMCIRLKLLLNPPNVEVKMFALSFEGQWKTEDPQKELYSLHNFYGFQPLDVDSNVLKNIRAFRDRCRQTHKQRLINLRKNSLHIASGEFSEVSSTEESNSPSDTEDSAIQFAASAISSDSVCLAAFQVMLKHIMGADKYLLGVKTSIRKGGALVGPLSDVMPMRVDLAKKGITFNSLLVSVIKSLRELKKQGSSSPYIVTAKKQGLPERFPVQFEFVTDRESQQWKYAGVNPQEFLPRQQIIPFDAGLEQPVPVEKLWSVDEQCGFDVKLVLIEESERISGGMVYRRDRFDEDKIAKWVGKYQTTLEGIEVGSRDVSISNLISRYYSIVFLNKSEDNLQSSIIK
ncbi:hypothetical protein HDU97_005519 [Phlyctochytrium planicorne]|nr:hypothetical protein HDU97_005519 [Phlyctochytrium planicorne]